MSAPCLVCHFKSVPPWMTIFVTSIAWQESDISHTHTHGLQHSAPLGIGTTPTRDDITVYLHGWMTMESLFTRACTTLCDSAANVESRDNRSDNVANNTGCYRSSDAKDGHVETESCYPGLQ
jgi:hypothetical protein